MGARALRYSYSRIRVSRMREARAEKVAQRNAKLVIILPSCTFVVCRGAQTNETKVPGTDSLKMALERKRYRFHEKKGGLPPFIFIFDARAR